MKDNGWKIIKYLYRRSIIDKTSIQRHVHWIGFRHQDYNDYSSGGGTELIDNLSYAKDVFVMVVGLNTHWKVPIVNYLINGVTAKEKVNIVISCLRQLHETGIMIKTLIFDGASNNMTSSLWANLDYADFKPAFKHPSTEINVHLVLDPYHLN